MPIVEAANCESAIPPPATTTGEKGGLPTVSAAGRGEWNDALAIQIMQACAGGIDPDEKDILGKRLRAGLAAMRGIEPGDILEDMAVAQLIAAHHAAMQAYGRAAQPDQPFAVWRESLNQANRLSRTFAAMLEALNRHRGKGGQQRVVVEHVTVNEGGQAVVGAVERPGGGGAMAEKPSIYAMHAAPRCGAKTRRGTPCQSPAMANGRCRMHGGKLPGAPRGNRYAWKHGYYSAAEKRKRKEVHALIREMRSLMGEVGA